MRNNLSTLAYQVKPKENVGKITFQEYDNLNVAQTLALLCMGRCLCANYEHEGDNLRMHEKKADNFISTHFVFVDCDGADISATEFTSLIHEEYKPTCYYSSYSDDKNGTRRFHLMWFFNEPLNYIQAQTTGKFLNSVCVKAAEGKNVAIDTCNNPCQMLFGSFMPNEKGNTNKLYTYNEIISSDEFQDFDMNDVEEKEVKHAHKAKKTAKNRENVPFIDFNMIKSFLKDSDAVFFEKYQNSYYKGWVNYRYEKPNEWLTTAGIAYQYTDENYFALPYYIHNGHFSESSSESIKNWFMRELAISMLINQGCDINRVAFRLLLKIREQNVDSEGLLDQHTIVSAMESAATMTTQEIEEKYAERLSFLRKVSVLKSGIIIRKSLENRHVGYSTLLKQIKTELVLSVVSGMETPKEALAIVQQNEKTKRLKITEEWIKDFYSRTMRFNETRNLAKLGNQLNAIRELLEEDKNLSVRKLLALLKERKGITIGIATLQRRLKELKN